MESIKKLSYDPSLTLLDFLKIFLSKKLWKSHFFSQHLRNTPPLSKPTLSELLRYFSNMCPSAQEYEEIFQALPKDITTLNSNSLLNLLFIIHIYVIRTSNKLVSLRYFENKPLLQTGYTLENIEYFPWLLENLLKSEIFSFCETSMKIGEKQYLLKYNKSFMTPSKESMKKDSVILKILPCNATLSPDIEEMCFKLPELNTEKTQEYGLIEMEEIKLAQYKYFIYLEYSSKLAFPVENQRIFADFTKAQSKYLNYLKSKDEYANFLVEISLIFNLMEISYKTTYICEETGVLIDIAILEKKIGFLYYDHTHSVRNIDGGRVLPDNLMLMKCHELEKRGQWEIHLINYDEWIRQYNTRSKREEFMAFCRNNKEN